MKDNRATKGYSLKDQLFNVDKIRYLSGLFEAADAGFDGAKFQDSVMAQLPALELKARISMIAEVLEQHLSSDFETAAAQILAALPPELDPTRTDDDFGDFIMAPLGAFVSNNGLDHLPLSLGLLREMTKRFSVEFDIRYFLNAHPVATMAALKQWAKDPNYHVRRLVSEGTRPTLPWGKKICIAVHEPLELLDVLHHDKARFVTRSVANHLNDIAKKDPELVITTLKRWAKLGKQDTAELDWMTRHALRTLVKKGDLAALELLGYRAAPEITVSEIQGPDGLEIGEVGTFDFTITAARDEKLMIDYVVDFIKKNGSSRPRVFKLKKLEIKAGERIELSKNHRFLKDATTFTHYPGPHCMWLQINGQKHGLCEFELR
ncbi:MAG: DNA alkylation repair protein [Rhodobacteraceae bacterium]|nr:DNA alkylation repair protein [Paracoccaceae bacterium]